MHAIKIHGAAVLDSRPLVRWRVNHPIVFHGSQRLPADAIMIGRVSDLRGERLEAVANEVQIDTTAYPIDGVFATNGGAGVVDGRVNRRRTAQTTLAFSASLVSSVRAVAECRLTYVPPQLQLNLQDLVRPRTETDSEGNHVSIPPSREEIRDSVNFISELRHESTPDGSGVFSNSLAAGASMLPSNLSTAKLSD